MHHSYDLRVDGEKQPPLNEHLSHYQLVYALGSAQPRLTICQILDMDPPLHFALLRLQLVEIIRTCTAKPDGDVGPALDFATEKLGPRAPTNPQFLEDLEKTMTLLVFAHDPKTLDPSLAALLKPDLRRDVADKVNKAIVGRQLNRRDAAIRHLVQMRAWAENTVRKDAKNDLPARIDLGLNGEEVDRNGQDVVMT